jgi:hypothetical protein
MKVQIRVVYWGRNRFVVRVRPLEQAGLRGRGGSHTGRLGPARLKAARALRGARAGCRTFSPTVVVLFLLRLRLLALRLLLGRLARQPPQNVTCR